MSHWTDNYEDARLYRLWQVTSRTGGPVGRMFTIIGGKQGDIVEFKPQERYRVRHDLLDPSQDEADYSFRVRKDVEPFELDLWHMDVAHGTFAIYRFEGESLVICSTINSKTRPSEFVANDRHVLAVYTPWSDERRPPTRHRTRR